MKPLTNRSPQHIHFGVNQSELLRERIEIRRQAVNSPVIWLVDCFFKENPLNIDVSRDADDCWIYVDTSTEPSIELVDQYVKETDKIKAPCAVVAIGGGSTMDIAKALANLKTNPGKAEDYQGWDLVQNAAPWKIAIPTLSGTGSEGSRTCVMVNQKKGLKLGMNSPHTVFDELILDPSLSKSVPRLQYFYTGMDTYIHCIESLKGNYRHALSDAWSREALALCREVFTSNDMMSDDSREKMMTASLLGGMAIGNSLVGLVHPFSAGLSMVHHSRHGVSNCVALRALEEYYPDAAKEMLEFTKIQGITLPDSMNIDLDEKGFNRLRESTIIHTKPLENALGSAWREILSDTKIRQIFKGI